MAKGKRRVAEAAAEEAAPVEGKRRSSKAALRKAKKAKVTPPASGPAASQTVEVQAPKRKKRASKAELPDAKRVKLPPSADAAARRASSPIGGCVEETQAPAPVTKKRSSKAAKLNSRKAKLSGGDDSSAARGDKAPRKGKLGMALDTPVPAKKNAYVPTDGAYTYEPDPDDHCETDIRAYRHLKPLLLQLEKAIHGTKSGQLRLWDPYYCNGAVARHLASLGFPKVHNKNEDFYAVLRSGKLPPHDVLITSPPYSGDHIERCMRHCAASGKPWCVLLPNWVHKKDYYQELLRTAPSLAGSAPMYLGPVGRSYNYWFPEGHEQRPSHVGNDGRTTPYATSWAVHFPGSVGGMKLMKNLEAEQRRLGEWVIAKTVKGLKWSAQKVEQRHSAALAKTAAQAQRRVASGAIGMHHTAAQIGGGKSGGRGGKKGKGAARQASLDEESEE